MQIDWLHFTPWSSLAGGLLLGISAVILFLYSGRILGVTGIIERLIPPVIGDTAWRISFLLGLFISPIVAKFCFPEGWLNAPQIDASWEMILLAGLFVGIGTRWGAGCTSGHGICGLSRLSIRSVIATISFMTSGFVIVFLTRHIL